MIINMNSIRSYKALNIVINVEQCELVKRLIKENKEREEFYRTIKNNLLQMREYHIQMMHCADYTSDSDDEDGDDWRTHDEFLQTIASILVENFD